MESAQSAYTDSLRETQEHEKALSLLAERHQHAEERLATLSAQAEENHQKLTEVRENVETYARALAESQAEAAEIDSQAAQDQAALSGAPGFSSAHG